MLLFPDLMVDYAQQEFGLSFGGFTHPTWNGPAGFKPAALAGALQLFWDTKLERFVINWCLGHEFGLFSCSCYARSLKTDWKCTKIGKKIFKKYIHSLLLYHRLQEPARSQLGRKPQNQRWRCWKKKTSQKHVIGAELQYQDYKGKSENSCRKLLKRAGREKLLCSR